MNDKILHGQGATPERLKKTNMARGFRGVTGGGIPNAYGHYDTEHCALDILLNGGYIDDDQYNSGYRLRGYYYGFNITGKWIFDGGGGYEGDVETEADIAREKYNTAIKQVSLPYRQLVHTVCIEATTVPTYYSIMSDIINGMEELTAYFETQFTK